MLAKWYSRFLFLFDSRLQAVVLRAVPIGRPVRGRPRPAGRQLPRTPNDARSIGAVRWHGCAGRPCRLIGHRSLSWHGVGGRITRVRMRGVSQKKGGKARFASLNRGLPLSLLCSFILFSGTSAKP